MQGTFSQIWSLKINNVFFQCQSLVKFHFNEGFCECVCMRIAIYLTSFFLCVLMITMTEIIFSCAYKFILKVEGCIKMSSFYVE